MSADLDGLLALGTVATGLRATLGVEPTGVGGACLSLAESTTPPSDANLLALVGTGEFETAVFDTSLHSDEFGFTWISTRQDTANPATLVHRLHRICTVLAAAGYGPDLRFASVGFTGAAERRLALVYLVERGTFYPFAPQRIPLRDSAFELRVRAELEDRLPIEPDVSRWFPTWNAPVP